MDVDVAEQRTIDQLDAAYAEWARELTSEEVTALRLYQSSERAYGLVNGTLRGSVDPSDLDASDIDLVGHVIGGVSSALTKGAVRNAVTVWRGVRSLERTLGAARSDAASLVGTRKRMAGFASCTVVRSVAEDQFTDPTDPVLLRIAVPAGVHAAWVPLVGHAAFKYEYELLLEEDLICAVTGVEEVEGILVLDCEVSR